MENVLKVDSCSDLKLSDFFIFILSVCVLLLGLFLGYRNRLVICKELQPIIHNIHNFIPVVKHEEIQTEEKEEIVNEKEEEVVEEDNNLSEETKTKNGR
jgi:uncharacterized membrane protein